MMSYQNLADLTNLRHEEILRETEGQRMLRRAQADRPTTNHHVEFALTLILAGVRAGLRSFELPFAGSKA